MNIEVSIVIDAPRDDVFAILTDYGAPVRQRINPELRSQTVLERHGNVVVCENVWEREGRTIRQRRRYTVIPPDRIVEEALDNQTGMTRVDWTVGAHGEQTRLIMNTTYKMPGIWNVLGRVVEPRLRQTDEELLETLRVNIEDEFEEVVEE